jgi:ferric-dicitrate binding protein FerR (iron transport regulator)
MTLQPNRRDELVELLGAVRDERIGQADFQRLERLLMEDGEARELYVQYMTLHASLEQIGAGGAVSGRLRETIRDEETIRELRAMIADDERSAFASRSARTPTRWRLTMALTTAALILIAVLVGPRVLRQRSVAARSAQIAAVYGQAESTGGGGRIQAALGAVLPPGGSLKTGPDAYVRLRYPDGSTVDLKDDTELVLLDGTPAKWLQLVTGTAFFEIAPQPASAPLIVNPDRYDQVEVAGTSFQVRREQDAQTRVLVVGGSVLFGAQDVAVPVAAKQASVAQREQGPSKPESFDPAAIWQGLSRGLTGTYYEGEDLTGKTLTRVDPKVDFDWGKGSPDPALGPDKFSARWTGWVEAEHTERYTFYVIADEGARLWIDGNLVIDAWKNASGEKRESPPIELVASRAYDVKLEYHESQEEARIQLLWSSPSTPRAVVPHSRLYPGP